MKKILCLFLIVFLAACQKQIVPVKSRAFYLTNVGTAPNDGTGTPIRQAFIWNNANWVAQQDTNGMVRDSLGNIYTEIQVRNKIRDTIAARLLTATDMEAYVTSRLAGYGGSGSALGKWHLKGQVGVTTGFPVNGDSLIINSGFIAHNDIKVYRDGHLIDQHLTNVNSPDGYKFASATGTITFKPVLATGTLIEVEAYDPIITHELIPEGGGGGGGGSGASIILTGLLGYYALNENAGTTVVDATGTQNGVSSAVVNQIGRFGRSQYFDGTTAVVNIPYNVSQRINGAIVSISCWVNMTTLPSVLGHESYLIRATVSGAPYETIHLTIGDDNKVHFTVRNTTSSTYGVESAGTLTAGSWFHILAVCPGAGSDLKIYLNGADVSTAADEFAGTMYVNNSLWYLGNAYSGAGAGLAGYLDEVLINNTDVSSSVTDLQTKVYPFN